MVATGRSRVRVAAMLVVAILLAPAVALLFATPIAHAWTTASALAVEGWGRGLWRVLRGGVKWIAPPVVSLAVLWALLHLVRHRRHRTALVAFVVGAGAFLTTEAIKFGFLPFPTYTMVGTQELSGHVAMTASAFVVAVLALAGRHRPIGVAAAVILLVGMCVAILVSRWHGVADVVIALAVTTSWVLAARAWLTATGRGTPPPRPRRNVWPAAGASSCAIAAWLLVVAGDAASGAAHLQALGAGVLAIVAAVLTLTIVTTGLAAQVAAWQDGGAA